jgi:hypothetical protein
MGKELKRSTLPDRYVPGFLEELDRRSQIYKALRKARDEIVDDLGGEDNISHATLALVERFTFLEACLQTWEVMIAERPKDADSLIGRWIQGCNALQGLAKAIGIGRKKKAGDLKAYLKERRA